MNIGCGQASYVITGVPTNFAAANIRFLPKHYACVSYDHFYSYPDIASSGSVSTWIDTLGHPS